MVLQGSVFPSLLGKGKATQLIWSSVPLDLALSPTPCFMLYTPATETTQAWVAYLPLLTCVHLLTQVLCLE